MAERGDQTGYFSHSLSPSLTHCALLRQFPEHRRRFTPVKASITAMADPQDTKGKGPAQDAPDGAENNNTNKETTIKELGKPGQKTIPTEMVDTLLRMNPALANELAGMPKEKAVEVLSKMDVSDLLTGMSLGNKNQKDMASYKFWQTQPVPRFDDQEGDLTEGPIKVINPEEVSKDPSPLIEGFEWVTLDLMDDNEVAELYDLLSNHYVEDDNAMFRFNYSRAFLHWYVFSEHELDHDGTMLTSFLLKGSDIPRLEKGMACGCSCYEVSQAGCLDLRCAYRRTGSRPEDESRRDQLPMCPQETAIETPCACFDQGNHSPILRAGHLPGHLHCGNCAA